jgi:hypothetical protein
VLTDATNEKTNGTQYSFFFVVITVHFSREYVQHTFLGELLIALCVPSVFFFFHFYLTNKNILWILLFFFSFEMVVCVDNIADDVSITINASFI